MRTFNTLLTASSLALAGAAIAGDNVTTGPPTKGETVTTGPPTYGEVTVTGAGNEPFALDNKGYVLDEDGRRMRGERGRMITKDSAQYYKRDEHGDFMSDNEGRAELRDDAPDFEVSGDGVLSHDSES
jgi:hypothetical protein